MGTNLAGKWIIELEHGVFRADWTQGDPPRTGKAKFARQYRSFEGALRGLSWCRKYRPFRNAKVIKVAELAK